MAGHLAQEPLFWLVMALLVAAAVIVLLVNRHDS